MRRGRVFCDSAVSAARRRSYTRSRGVMRFRGARSPGGRRHIAFTRVDAIPRSPLPGGAGTYAFTRGDAIPLSCRPEAQSNAFTQVMRSHSLRSPEARLRRVHARGLRRARPGRRSPNPFRERGDVGIPRVGLALRLDDALGLVAARPKSLLRGGLIPKACPGLRSRPKALAPPNPGEDARLLEPLHALQRRRRSGDARRVPCH